MTEIIPAILPKSSDELREKLALVPRDAKTVHIDFARREQENLVRFTHSEMGSDTAKDFLARSARLFLLEAHLMMPHPQEHIAPLVAAGFARIVIQCEDLTPEAFAELIHEWRGSVEIVPSLLLETPLGAIESFAHEVRSVQLMAIAKIGSQGQPFDERVVQRIRELHRRYPAHIISIDGGVSGENAPALAAAGAERLVVGSRVNDFYGAS